MMMRRRNPDAKTGQSDPTYVPSQCIFSKQHKTWLARSVLVVTILRMRPSQNKRISVVHLGLAARDR